MDSGLMLIVIITISANLFRVNGFINRQQDWCDILLLNLFYTIAILIKRNNNLAGL